jgi:hypothetical protein
MPKQWSERDLRAVKIVMVRTIREEPAEYPVINVMPVFRIQRVFMEISSSSLQFPGIFAPAVPAMGRIIAVEPMLRAVRPVIRLKTARRSAIPVMAAVPILHHHKI